MTAVVLSMPSTLPPASRAVDTGSAPKGDAFAGVLEKVGARPDPAARRKSAAGRPGVPAEDGAAEPGGGAAGNGDVAPGRSGVIDVSLLMAAALTASPDVAATPSTSAAPPARTSVRVATPTSVPGSVASGGTLARSGVNPSGADAGASTVPGEPVVSGGTRAGSAAPTPASQPGAGPGRDAIAAGAAASTQPTLEAGSGAASSDIAGPLPAQGDGTAGAAVNTVAGDLASPLRPAATREVDPPGDQRAALDKDARDAAPSSPATGAGPSLSPADPRTKRVGPPAAVRGVDAGPPSRARPAAGGTNTAGSAAAHGLQSGAKDGGRASGEGQESAVARAAPDTVAASAPTTSVAEANALPPPLVAQQVATALRSFAEASGPAREPAAAQALAASGVTHVATSASAGVKSLTVELDPGHLGPVSITLQMKGETVSVHIAVANPDTLHMLERDRATLTAAVNAIGGSADALQLGRDTPTSLAGLPADGTGRQPTFLSDGSTTGRQAPHPGRQSGRADGEPSHDDATPPAALPTRRLDGSLYL